MPATTPPVARILVAENPAEGAGQDRVFTLSHAVIVLDGASTPDPQPRDSAWYADTLGSALRERLRDEPSSTLKAVLADAIADVAARFSLQPGASPSSTVAMLRWSTDDVDALVLGDSPIVVRTTGGNTAVLDDSRLDHVAADLRAEIRKHLRGGEGYSPQHRERMRQLNAQERAARNKPDGYWIAEAVPAAADHAHTRHWRTHEVDHALLMTDGVSRAVTVFGRYPSWAHALEAAQQLGPQHLCQAVREAEAADRNGQRWQRSKPVDDQAAVLVNFSAARPPRDQGTTESAIRRR